MRVANDNVADVFLPCKGPSPEERLEHLTWFIERLIAHSQCDMHLDAAYLWDQAIGIFCDKAHEIEQQLIEWEAL